MTHVWQRDETPGIREYEVQSSPLSWTVIRDMAQIEGFAVQGDGHVTLAVAETPPSVATGTITVPSPFAFYPSTSVSASIHRCEGTDHGSCAICGHFPLTSVGATNVFFTIPVEGAEPTIPDVGHNPSQSFVFHNWVENPDYSIRDYAVLLHPVPGNTGASSSDMCGSWTKLSGPDSGTLLATNMVDLLLRRPTEGGIYRFRYEENASVGLGSVESEVILPLGGPDVTGYLRSEMPRLPGHRRKLPKVPHTLFTDFLQHPTSKGTPK